MDGREKTALGFPSYYKCITMWVTDSEIIAYENNDFTAYYWRPSAGPW
jgi:hypothetical protein